ncbi:MAG: carbohydrate-binding domain-containing protein [Ruminococcus sp.]|nr:carbohydrate-binding domain-containing protein [Ruminococcus sp.]
MKNYRRILALLASFSLMFSAFSCGQETAVESSLSEDSIVEILDETKENIESDENNNDNDEDTADSTGADENENADNSETTTAPADDNNENTVTTAPADNSNEQTVTTVADNNTNNNTPSATTAVNNTPSGNAQVTTAVQGGSSSGGNKVTTTTKAKTPVVTTTTTTTAEVKVYSAEVVLGGSPVISGSNVTANGSGITITGGGDYLISGSVADGMIEVNTTEKVKIYMNGVTITNSSGPAIQVTDAKRFIMVLMEGTTTKLTDGGNSAVYDGALFSNDTVEIKGKGSLEITSNNAHGISSDDDIVIENGNITINSKKTGLMANDDITINGGKLNIKSGTNGMKSKGTMNINGGYSVITGGTKEEKSAVYAAGALNYTGGYLYAAGNAMTAPTSSASPYAVVGYTSGCTAGSNVAFRINGSQVVSFTPNNAFRCVMILSPDLTSGSTLGVSVGTASNDFTISDIANIFTV